MLFLTIFVQRGLYTNEVDGYSIQFPKGWSIVKDTKHTPAYTGAYSPKTNPAECAEMKVVVLPGIAVSELTSAMQNDITIARSISNDVKIERNQAITIGGLTGQVVQLALTSPRQGLIRMINYGFAKNNRLYFIRCFGNQAYFQHSAGEVQKACLSLRIK
ncbi:PsbP-related protein [Spirosoma aerophilum]